jgi:uncharacterized protein YcfJ
MNTRIVTAIAVLALSGAGLAYADHRPDGDYDGGRYDGSRQSDYDTARVVRVEPLSRRIRVLEPRRECRLETVYDGGYYRDRNGYRDRGGDVRTTNSTIIGGLIGGAIGNQIGRGEGRRIATVAGALIGAAVGHDTAQRGRDDRYGYGYGDRYDDRYDDDRGRSREVERCRVRHEERFEERIDGYRVTYVYNGREFTTRMSYDPGPQLRVRVHVSPEQGY